MNKKKIILRIIQAISFGILSAILKVNSWDFFLLLIGIIFMMELEVAYRK